MQTIMNKWNVYFVNIAAGLYQKLMRSTTKALASMYAPIALKENSPNASVVAK